MCVPILERRHRPGTNELAACIQPNTEIGRNAPILQIGPSAPGSPEGSPLQLLRIGRQSTPRGRVVRPAHRPPSDVAWPAEVAIEHACDQSGCRPRSPGYLFRAGCVESASLCSRRRSPAADAGNTCPAVPLSETTVMRPPRRTRARGRRVADPAVVASPLLQVPYQHPRLRLYASAQRLVNRPHDGVGRVGAAGDERRTRVLQSGDLSREPPSVRAAAARGRRRRPEWPSGRPFPAPRRSAGSSRGSAGGFR